MPRSRGLSGAVNVDARRRHSYSAAHAMSRHRFSGAGGTDAAPSIAAIVGIAGTAFLFRWVTLDFENDYFMHMAWAADMLRGERPVRDFVEQGFPLQTLLAYAGLRLGGYQLLWEAVIACGLIAASVAFTHAICRRAGLPGWLSLAAAIVAAASFPRMYAYPKAFVYPAALLALTLYVHRPGRRSLLLTAAETAVAFLFRHDHGAWIAVAMAIAFAIFHWSEPTKLARTLISYSIAAALLVSPWALWVAASGHAGHYVEFLRSRSGGLTNRGRLPDRKFQVDRSAPWLALAPVEYPVVGIRWAAATSDEDRVHAAGRYGLEPVESGTDDYRLLNRTKENVRAIVLDPAVEDTRGIDRGTLRVPRGSIPWIHLQSQRYLPVVRLRVLPGVVTAANAEPWLTWVSFTLPWAVLAVVLAALVRPASNTLDRETLSTIVPASALSIITFQTLVRSSPDSRLGDIAALTGLLLAWLAWRGWQAAGPARLAIRTAAIALLLATLASAASYGRVLGRLSDAGIDGPVNFVRRAWGQTVLYGGLPLDLYAPPGAAGLPGLSRWLNQCTRETDRVSVIGFEPQVFFLSERGFAGGHAFFDLGWNSSERDQQLAIERWSRQDVPVVLAMDTEWEPFSRDYPQVRAFIDSHYDVQQRSSFGGGKEVTVLVNKAYPAGGTHPPTGLPCWTPGYQKQGSGVDE